MKTPIDLFFAPKRVALIGASDNVDKVGGILMKKLLDYSGGVVPVNPGHTSIFGKKCYASVLNFYESIDLAILAVPSKFVASVLEECGKKDIKNLIIVSAGFSEIGNKDLENDILNIAGKYGMRILGPNCFGVCNPSKNFDVTFAMNTPKKGDIAFISQSGSLWSYVADGNRGFSGFVSLGNMADLEFPDFIEYFSKDRKTKSIVLYVEKLKNGRKFINVCKKYKKKIYVVKSGSSKEGEKAAFSHTGSLATDFNIYRGAFKQARVILCSSIEEALDRASGKKAKNKIKKLNISKKVFFMSKIKNFGSPKKLDEKYNKVFLVTNAGGAGALASDYLSNSGFEIANIPELKNPLDILGTAKSSDYKKALEIIDGVDVDSIVVIVTPQSMTDVENIAGELVNFKKKSKKKIVALLLGDKSVTKSLEILKQGGVVGFNTLEEFRQSLR